MNYQLGRVLRTDRTWLDMMDATQLREDMDIIASGYDGKRCKYNDFGFSVPTERINAELKRRGINYQVGRFVSSGFARMLIIPGFIGISQVITAMNLLSADYNLHG